MFRRYRDAVRHFDALDALHLKLGRWRNAEGRRKIAAHNFRCSDGGLQIVVGLRGRAASLEHIGQCCQSVLEPGFGRLLHGLRVLQICFCCILLPNGIQQPVISLHHLENDRAMRVIELKISRQEIARADRYLRTPAEVQDGVIQG